MTGTLRGALEARGIDATDGPLEAEAVGEVYLDGRVLIVRKISLTYRISGVPADKKETAERVHAMHADRCPVARSISPQIEIETKLEYV
ncbi:MAG: OsmC family protein [Acidobacteria bacterium]|nr:OsmC family protein [Acidobacteriota bacterium]